MQTFSIYNLQLHCRINTSHMNFTKKKWWGSLCICQFPSWNFQSFLNSIFLKFNSPREQYHKIPINTCDIDTSDAKIFNWMNCVWNRRYNGIFILNGYIFLKRYRKELTLFFFLVSTLFHFLSLFSPSHTLFFQSIRATFCKLNKTKG